MRASLVVSTILLLLLATPVAKAQKFIDLSDRSLAIGNAAITVDSVIVAFNDTAAIGDMLVGRFYKRVPVYLGRSVKQSLDDFVHRSLSDSAHQHHVVLKINRLAVAERRIGRSDVTFAGLNIEFLSVKNGMWIREYIHGSTSWSSGPNFIRLFGKDIAKAITECLTGYHYALRSGTITELPVSDRDLAIPVTPEQLHLPILTSGQPKDGVYHTFMEMANDRPSTPLDFRAEVVGIPGEQRELVVTGEQKDLARDAWGICFNGRVFIRIGTHFIGFERDINGFHVEQLMRAPSLVDHRTSVGTYVMFGALGGLFFGGHSMDVVSHRRLDLDMLTGQLILPEPPVAGTESRTLFICEGGQACLFIYSEKEACLMKDQHHTVRLVIRKESVPVEVRIANLSTVTITIDTHAEGAQVYLIGTDADGGPMVRQAEPSNAAELLGRMRPENEVK